MNEHDQLRKIQFTGKSSYIVSLPKGWIIEQGLKQGDQVNVSRQGSSVLEIKPINISNNKNQEEAIITVSNNDDESAILRKLIALYFLHYQTIHIKPKTDRINPGQRSSIRNAVKNVLMGAEITSDSTEGITIQILINLVGLSVDGAFKRMLHLAKSMQEDVLIAVKEGNVELAEQVIKSDDDVDRFGFYIIRQLTIAIENVHMLEEMGFSNARDCLGYRVIVKNIERLADHAERIAKDVIEFKKPVNEKTYDKLVEMSNYTLELIDNSCLAMFKKDTAEAEETIIRAGKVAKYEKKVLDTMKLSKNQQEVYRVRKIIENLRRIAEYGSDIGEIVLNTNIEKMIKKK
jgi:phosphate uptake regulator|tara:strand:+ start:3627 stop:4667 length:1041 start_codon:yes stop_codon:yes gene_type:complete